MSRGDPSSSYRAIENLIATYAELVDAGDFAAVGELLANATFRGGAGSVSGTDAIEKMLQENVIVYDDGTPRTKHVTTNVSIEIDDEAGTAVSRSYFTVLQALPHLPLQPIASGRLPRSPRAAQRAVAFRGAAGANRSRRRHEPPSAPPTRRTVISYRATRTSMRPPLGTRHLLSPTHACMLQKTLGPHLRGVQAASADGRRRGPRAGRYFLCGARSRCDEAVRGAGGWAVVAVRRLGKTPPFRGPRGEVVPGSVAEVAYRRLGGLDQWVMIRGESVANPALILLHGGPGWSETGFFRHFNAPLEKSFTVVYWDQRGAGKSFDSSIPRSSITVEQFISDLDELVDAVCRRLDKPKVAIFGHSWGSVFGVLYAARFPEKVAAYVGSGQIGDWPAAEAASYEWALAEAQRVGNRRAVRKLRAIGPPPYPAAAVFTERTWVSRFEGQMRPRAL